MSFHRLRKRFRSMEQQPGRPGPAASLDELVWCVEAASRYVPAATCLARSMAAQVLLRRGGYNSTLRIGVARTGLRVLEAHAWVECEGRVVVGQVENFERFTPLPPVDAVAN